MFGGVWWLVMAKRTVSSFLHLTHWITIRYTALRNENALKNSETVFHR
jgi:hypothetical protein